MVKQQDLQGWALIMGGSSGLGQATAIKLASHGMDIIIIHRDRRTTLHQLESTKNKIAQLGQKVLSYNIDVCNQEKTIQAIDELKSQGVTANVIVHSISRGNVKAMTSSDNVLSEADFISTATAMSYSLATWVQLLAQKKMINHRCRVIAYTSEGGRRPLKSYAAVSSAKASIEAIIRSIALEYAHLEIRANSIQAGVTDTPSLRIIPDAEEILLAAQQRSLSGRITTPEDVANATYLLCRPEGDWVNGTILTVDGGESLR